MAQNILSSGSEELKKVRDMLAEDQGLRVSVEGVRTEKAKADRTLQTEEKAVEDRINSTVKKRRADLEGGFNREIQQEQSVLKKVKSARDKAKSKGIEGRIAEETSELREKNRMLHVAIRSMFKQKGLPKFCDSKLYYALYMPSRLSDILTCVVFIALFFVILPGAGSFFVDEEWQKVVVFVATWVVVAAIYLLLYRMTKGKNREVLVDMKDSRKEIRKNEKEIRRIKKSIHADKSEEQYGLEGFDEKIQAQEETIAELTDRKHTVMMDFETNTRKAIADEITAQNAARIEAMRNQCAELEERLKTLSKREKELSSCLAAEYQVFLGEEYMDLDRLQVLISLIDTGKAKTVREAMSLWEKQEQDRLSGETKDAGDGEEASEQITEPEPETDEVPEFADEGENEEASEDGQDSDEVPELTDESGNEEASETRAEADKVPEPEGTETEESPALKDEEAKEKVPISENKTEESADTDSDEVPVLDDEDETGKTTDADSAVRPAFEDGDEVPELKED